MEIYESDCTCVLDGGATKFQVPQHDFGVPQHDFQVPQHDFEVSVAYIAVLNRTYAKIAQKLNLSNRQDANVQRLAEKNS